jgi:hypothetical protein
MSEEISNNKLLEIEELIIHEARFTRTQNEQILEIDNKMDKVLKKFNYLHDRVSRVENMKEENKKYYDSLTAKIHHFYFMYIVFAVLMIWLR